MMNPVINSQIGRVGPWRPAFLLSISMLIMTLSTVYWNEQNDKKFCKAPPFNSIKSPIVIATVGATIGNFIIQLVHISSQYESSRHRSSSLMILLMTFIQGCSQIASVTNVVTTGSKITLRYIKNKTVFLLVVELVIYLILYFLRYLKFHVCL